MGDKILTRADMEKRERELLAPYAMKSGDSLGRAYKEEEHPYRSAYQRDKDRIIYSTAFRRLEYKTQVFVNHEGDHYRTRLTHTIEVAQIARTISRALKLNEDLVEAIALAHDLGHTPFGHSGEETLSDLMRSHGGFDHNTHGLRVVDLLERRYPNFPGLNLTREVRKGIIRHSTPYDKKRMDITDVEAPWLLEIEVVDISDEIAYDNHDLEDGLRSGLLSEKDLAGVELWDKTIEDIEREAAVSDEETKRALIIRKLINNQVSDLINNTAKHIEELNINSIADIEKQKRKIVDFSEDMKAKRVLFKKVLSEKLYSHYRVVRMSNKASRFLRAIFQVFCDNPEQLPPHAYGKIEERGKHRVICDYIAGMTDRFALDQYEKFFEPYERV